MGFSPLKLKSSFSPHVILLLFSPPLADSSVEDLALKVLKEIKNNFLEAINSFIVSKIS